MAHVMKFSSYLTNFCADCCVHKYSLINVYNVYTQKSINAFVILSQVFFIISMNLTWNARQSFNPWK